MKAEKVTISFSRGSSQPRDWTQVSRTADRHFTVWATISPWKGNQQNLKKKNLKRDLSVNPPSPIPPARATPLGGRKQSSPLSSPAHQFLSDLLRLGVWGKRKEILFFFWSTVYLHCCVSFRYTEKWFNYIIYIYTRADSVPLQVISWYWI